MKEELSERVRGMAEACDQLQGAACMSFLVFALLCLRVCVYVCATSYKLHQLQVLFT